MRVASSLIFLITLTIGVSAMAIGRDAMQGKWDVTVTPDDDTFKAGEKEFKDTLTFKGSEFTSAVFVPRGFPPSVYEDDTRGGIAATFKAHIKSTKGQGTADWSGTSTGVDLTGELTWTRPDGTLLRYTLKGTKT